jgi:hypothetical protein
MNEKPKRTQIPFTGSSATIPTGAIQFQADWPGLFVRGDEAIALAAKIRAMDKALRGNSSVAVKAVLIELRRLAQIIETDVKE